MTHQASAPLTPAALNSQLAALEAGGLILLARLQPEVEYLFRHALVQEAAYLSLVKSDRRRLHHAVGEALEQLYPDQAASAELAPVLARHFVEAGDDAAALRYFAAAGRAAAGMYATAEAVDYFGRALALARPLAGAEAVAADLYLQRGHALELNAQDAEALANYEAMQAWAEARGDQPARLAALIARGTVCVKPTVAQNLPLGWELSQTALSLARELGDRPAEAKVLWNMLQYCLGNGRYDEAEAYGEQALAIARETGLKDVVGYVLTDLLKAYFQNNRVDDTWAAVAEARALWRELGTLNMLADNLGTTTMLHVLTGKYEQALQHSAEARQVGERIGNLWNQAYALYLVELVHFDRGDIGLAIETGETCRRLSQQAGFAEGLSQASLNLALIYAYMGDTAQARQEARTAEALSQPAPGVPAWPMLVAAFAWLHLLDNEPDQALATLQAGGLAGEPEALKREFFLTYLFATLVHAELALAHGEAERAVALIDDLLPFFEATGIRLFYTDALHSRGRALRAAGQAAAARHALETARAEAQALGARRMLWPVLAELAALADDAGDHAAARALRREAASAIDYIARHAGSAELAETFLNKPAVREVLTRLDQ